MGQIAVILILVTLAVIAFGLFPQLNPVADQVHRWLFGSALAHPKGTIEQHINDWLSFLPDNSTFRAFFVAAILVLAILLNILYYLAASRRQQIKKLEEARDEARIRTRNVYRHQQ